MSSLFIEQPGYKIVYFLLMTILDKFSCKPPLPIDNENSWDGRNFPQRPQINK